MQTAATTTTPPPATETADSLMMLTSTKTTRGRKWNIMFRKLVEYKIKKGDCAVPQNYPHYPSLAYWVHLQPKQFKDPIQQHEEYSERRARLDGIGFIWKLKRTWKESYSEQKSWIETHGSEPTNEREPRLANWVSQQQRFRFKLSTEQQQMLSDIGIDLLSCSNPNSVKYTKQQFCKWQALLSRRYDQSPELEESRWKDNTSLLETLNHYLSTNSFDVVSSHGSVTEYNV